MEWRKKLSTMTGVFLALLTLGLIWTGQMEVMAAQIETGTLIVQLDEMGTPRDSVGFTAYYVGGLNDNSEWKLIDGLQSTGVDLDGLVYADEWDAAALKLAHAADFSRLTASTGQTNAEGTMTLANLPAGMYLVVQDSGADTYGTVSPFLAGIPYLENGEWKTELTAHPKAELPTETDDGRIEVTKRTGYLDPELLEVIDLIPEDAVYYVGIFQDKQGTVPYGTDYLREIELKGTSTGTAVFENLPAGTYYIFETDSDGNAYTVNEIQSRDEYKWVCQVEDGSSQEVTLDGKAGSPAGTVGLYNLYYELPKAYSYNGNITITKTVTDGTNQITSGETFYAGIFRDQAGTDLYEVTELKQNGSVTIEVPLGGENGDEEITYYIYETDADGKRVDKQSFGYNVSGEGRVDLHSGNLKGEIVITNTKKAPTPTPTIMPTAAPTPTAAPGYSGGNTTPNVQDSGSSASPVRTGDDTPIALYAVIIAAALAIIAGCIIYLKGRKKHE